MGQSVAVIPIARSHVARRHAATATTCRLGPSLLACLATVVLVPATLAQPRLDDPLVTVRVQRGESAIHIDAQAAADVSVVQAWAVLTDYERLADFVPDMQSSRVVSAPGEPLRVEQRGDGRLGPLRIAVHVVLEMTERAPRQVAFRAVAGSFRRFEGEWRIAGDDAPVVLAYTARLEPDFWLPPGVGPAPIQADVARKVGAVVREMMRRAPPPPQVSGDAR